MTREEFIKFIDELGIEISVEEQTDFEFCATLVQVAMKVGAERGVREMERRLNKRSYVITNMIPRKIERKISQLFIKHTANAITSELRP